MSQSVPKLSALNPELVQPFMTERWASFVPSIVFTYDSGNGSLHFLNDKVSECLGYSPEELADNFNLSHLVHQEDAGSFASSLALLSTMPESHAQTINTRFNKSQGGCRHIKAFCTKFGEKIVVVAEDVTDQVRSEEEVASSRLLFDEAEKLLLFGTWSWGIQSDTLACTEGIYQLLDYESGAPKINKLGQLLDHVLPEHLEQIEKVLGDCNENGQEFECEFVLKSAASREKVVLMKGKPIFGDDGGVRRLMGTVRDITAKRNFENELDRNIRELNRSNKELEEFAYVASHDLHEPLRKVLTFSERLKSKFDNVLGDDGKVYLDRISASAESMRKLINNLLEFSRISRGARSIVSCDLRTVLNEVFSDQELRIEESSTTLNVDVLPIVEAVPAELKQLFNNLIGNALKFRRTDVSPVINITSRRLSHKEKSDLLLPFNHVFYCIEVQDNGIGFESVYAEKIFEIFQRLHGKTEYSGSGIGLAICKKIAENHDGLIFATGEPGKGATFSLILPEKQR